MNRRGASKTIPVHRRLQSSRPSHQRALAARDDLVRSRDANDRYGKRLQTYSPAFASEVLLVGISYSMRILKSFNFHFYVSVSCKTILSAYVPVEAGY